jgi:hypothetical protein
MPLDWFSRIGLRALVDGRQPARWGGTSARWRVPVVLLAILLFALGVPADPPPALRDSGDCGIDKSQPSTVTRGGKEYEARSFFEPARLSAVGGIDKKDLDALAKEVGRLQGSSCFDVCVRSLVTADGFAQACANCDFVFIVAHGSNVAPYLAIGGDKAAQLQQWPATVNAGSVWLGACHGNEAAQQLNGASGTTYRSLPNAKFDAQGCALRNDIIRGLTAELAALKDTAYCKRKKVCVLSAVQEVVAVQ